MSSSSPNIFIISGSARHPSHTAALTDALGSALNELGTRVTYWLTAGRCLLHPGPGAEVSADVAELLRSAGAADGFVFATPVYHGSYSACLKGALDHLRKEHVLYRPVGLMCHGAERTGQATDHLRGVVRALGGFSLPTEVASCDTDFGCVGDNYLVTSAAVARRLDRLAHELTTFALMARDVGDAAQGNGRGEIYFFHDRNHPVVIPSP